MACLKAHRGVGGEGRDGGRGGYVRAGLCVGAPAGCPGCQKPNRFFRPTNTRGWRAGASRSGHARTDPACRRRRRRRLPGGGRDWTRREMKKGQAVSGAPAWIRATRRWESLVQRGRRRAFEGASAARSKVARKRRKRKRRRRRRGKRRKGVSGRGWCE